MLELAVFILAAMYLLTVNDLNYYISGSILIHMYQKYIKPFLEIVSGIGSLVTLGLLIINWKGFSLKDILENPYAKVLFYSLILTGIIFLVPLINKKLPSFFEKIIVYPILSVLIVIVIVLWNKNGYDSQQKVFVPVKKAPQIITNNETKKDTFLPQKPPIIDKKPINLRKRRSTPTIAGTAKYKVPNPPQMGITSTGSNAHNVAGFGNFVGINGDVYTDKEKVLSESDLSKLYTQIKAILKTRSNNNIDLKTFRYTNIPTGLNQISDYFKARGLDALAISTDYSSTDSKMIKGIQIYNNNPDMVEIWIGHFD